MNGKMTTKLDLMCALDKIVDVLGGAVDAESDPWEAIRKAYRLAIEANDSLEGGARPKGWSQYLETKGKQDEAVVEASVGPTTSPLPVDRVVGEAVVDGSGGAPGSRVILPSPEPMVDRSTMGNMMLALGPVYQVGYASFSWSPTGDWFDVRLPCGQCGCDMHAKVHVDIVVGSRCPGREVPPSPEPMVDRSTMAGKETE